MKNQYYSDYGELNQLTAQMRALAEAKLKEYASDPSKEEKEGLNKGAKMFADWLKGPETIATSEIMVP